MESKNSMSPMVAELVRSTNKQNFCDRNDMADQTCLDPLVLSNPNVRHLEKEQT